VAVAVAIMLNDIRGKLRRKIYQSCILMPYLISMIIVSYLAYAFLQKDYGFLNSTILPLFGIDPVNWYAYPKVWPFILTFINCWKQVGYLSIVFYASVVGISPDYFEAARLDGASKMQQIRHITLPMLRPTIVIMTLLAIGRIFNSDFGLFYQVPMDSGALYSVTNTLDTYVYRALISRGDIGMSSAACFYQSIVGFAMVLLSNFVVSKIDPDSALF
jgi:putative aldouronate transport system permease protein